MRDQENVIERGAETIRMPDNSGFAIAIVDYPDRQERVVTLLKVAADDSNRILHQVVESLHA
jgi:hypothetical protein